VFFVLILPPFFPDFLGFRQVHYGMLTVFDSFNREEITLIQYVYSSVFIAQFIHLFIYLMVSLKLLNGYHQKMSDNYSTFQESEIKWLRITIYSLIVIFVAASIFLVLFFFTLIYQRHLDYIYVLPMSFLMYVIAYKLSGIQFISIKESDVVINGSKYQSSSLKTEDAEQYSDLLKEYMAAQKPYLKNGLRLVDLSKDLEIPAHHLSQVINEKYSQNFFDFINRYRVEEAKSLMQISDESTLLEIAYSSGFNNKNSFNNAFKKFNSTTPFAYRKKMKSE
jgi:AraC-like DNA-binding protein